MKEQNNQIRMIIKYNPYREYVGAWTPKIIQTKLREIQKNPFRPLTFVATGGLSAEMVCDAIWNEMSYNPMRFGDTNPFETSNVSALRKFHKKYESQTKDTMSKIATELRHFLYFIGQSNPEFYKMGRINGNSILIKCDCNRKANNGYKALSCLVRIMHLIASQNLQDYKISAFRQKIDEIVSMRHPNLQRPRKYLNFIVMGRTAKQKDFLYSEIMQKMDDILDTNTRIKILNEYDPPVDTSDENALLAQQRQDLQDMEEQYALVKEQYEQMVARQKIIEK